MGQECTNNTHDFIHTNEINTALCFWIMSCYKKFLINQCENVNKLCTENFPFGVTVSKLNVFSFSVLNFSGMVLCS